MTTGEAPADRWPWAATVLWTVVLALLWLGLAGRWDVGEVAAAVVVGGLVTVVTVRTRRLAGVHDRHTRDWLRHGPGMVAHSFVDCGALMLAVVRGLGGRRPQGVTTALPCEVGGPDGADAGRRTLITWGTSLQPDSYVIGFDAGRRLVVVHQLVSTDDPPVAATLRDRP